MLLRDLSKKVLEICEQFASAADCTPHGVALHSLPARILANIMLCVIPWCMLGSLLFSQSKGNTCAGHSGQKGLKALMQPLPPAACCLLQPSSLPVACLAKPADSWRWCRPNVQAGRCQLTQTVFEVVAASLDCWGSHASQYDTCAMAEEEEPELSPAATFCS